MSGRGLSVAALHGVMRRTRRQLENTQHLIVIPAQTHSVQITTGPQMISQHHNHKRKSIANSPYIISQNYILKTCILLKPVSTPAFLARPEIFTAALNIIYMRTDVFQVPQRNVRRAGRSWVHKWRYGCCAVSALWRRSWLRWEEIDRWVGEYFLGLEVECRDRTDSGVCGRLSQHHCKQVGRCHRISC